jgi:hypothetical protein
MPLYIEPERLRALREVLAWASELPFEDAQPSGRLERPAVLANVHCFEGVMATEPSFRRAHLRCHIAAGAGGVNFHRLGQLRRHKM